MEQPLGNYYSYPPLVATRLAINTLLTTHPMSYTDGPGEVYYRCPVCEQWSPCDVRILIAATLDVFVDDLPHCGVTKPGDDADGTQ